MSFFLNIRQYLTGFLNIKRYLSGFLKITGRNGRFPNIPCLGRFEVCGRGSLAQADMKKGQSLLALTLYFLEKMVPARGIEPRTY